MSVLQKDQYYYAGGKRIALTPADDLFAVDERRLTEKGIPETIRVEVQKAAQPLISGIRLVNRDALSRTTTAALREVRAIQPVYHAHDALLIALPEVRVEESRPAKKKRLDDWLSSRHGEVIVRRPRDGQIVLSLTSGDGDDALDLANVLAEEVKPEMAQARFVRITQRPSATA